MSDFVGLLNEKNGEWAYFDDLQFPIVTSPPVELSLVVNTDGQTVFSVFSIPKYSQLIINEGVFLENTHYTIVQAGANVNLIWINTDFDLSTTDKITLLKY